MKNKKNVVLFIFASAISSLCIVQAFGQQKLVEKAKNFKGINSANRAKVPGSDPDTPYFRFFVSSNIFLGKTAFELAKIPGSDPDTSEGRVYMSGGIYMDAIRFLTNGPGLDYYDVFVGAHSGEAITSGNYNSGVGHNSLFKTTTGNNNTALGANTLYSNISGNFNAAQGRGALYHNTTGSGNTAIGNLALTGNTTGYSNVAIGTMALGTSKTGSNTVAIGDSALFNNNNNYHNVAIGSKSLFKNTTGNYNVATGFEALYANTTGGYNTATGYQALYASSGKAYNNTATGFQSLYANITGNNNVANGAYSLTSNKYGTANTAIGLATLYYNYNGNYNTALGFFSLSKNITGHSNTAIGAYADISSDSVTNATALGYGAIATASNQIKLGNTSVKSVLAAGNYIIYSDGRYKKDINENVPGLEFIKQLRPVTYHYDIHGMNSRIGAKTSSEKRSAVGDQMDTESAANAEEELAIDTKEKKLYTGFVAQEVEAVAKKLHYDFSGIYTPQNDKDLYGLSYSDFVIPLVKAVQELSAKNDEKDNRIASLEARLAKMEALIKSPAVASLSDASLDQNMPNPFDKTTSIAYNLPQRFNTARIQVTDGAGKLLKTINVSGSGRGTLTMDANLLSAGAYQYSLYINNKLISTKKMLLAKN